MLACVPARSQLLESVGQLVNTAAMRTAARHVACRPRAFSRTNRGKPARPAAANSARTGTTGYRYRANTKNSTTLAMYVIGMT